MNEQYKISQELSTEEKVISIKSMRVEIDGCIQHTKELQQIIGRNNGGREVSLCYTKLQEAKMWLGKALEEVGNELPEQYRDKYQG